MSSLVLTDSGGMQEEAAALGIPTLVLRERSERPEAIATGNIILAGTNRGSIVDAVLHLLQSQATLAEMARPSLCYGEGRAGQRIAAKICEWLGRLPDLPTLDAAGEMIVERPTVPIA